MKTNIKEKQTDKLAVNRGYTPADIKPVAGQLFHKPRHQMSQFGIGKMGPR
jgi:hypothetical protein